MATKKGNGPIRELKTVAATPAQAPSTPFLAKIKIGLKAGVSDPEGNNTLKALHLLGFDGAVHVATERIVHLTIRAANREAAIADAEKACRRLLTNPIIHDYRIDVEATG